jgi:diguanylate cyclase (GGDEF)-like protein
VICAGLEFSKVAALLFSEYDNQRVRSLIIDAAGDIRMDSDLLGDYDFLNSSFEIPIEEISSDPDFLAALKTHLDSIDGYFELRAKPLAVELAAGPYAYATIAPIVSTDWSVITFYKASPLFDPARLRPVFITMAALFTAFILITSAFSHRLILAPIELLTRSLMRLREDNEALVYGLERDDEIGILANTIQDLFVKTSHDPLTGLQNRRFLEKNLKRTIESMFRRGGNLSIIMVDVDFFSKYNEAYGNEMGDGCLKSIAGTLRVSHRTGDYAARSGGAEFVLVLPETDRQGACQVADRLLQKVRDLKIPHREGLGGQVTVSVGLTTGPVTSPTQSYRLFLDRAGEAMGQSKESGRDKYTFLDTQATSRVLM